MNILGIDFGTKRIGLAIKRSGVDLVLPFGVFEWDGTDEKLQDLVDLISKENFNKIVIGLPLDLDGKEALNTKRVREFADRIKEKIDIPIEFADERFSSHEADAIGGVAARDEKSAMLILEEYLSS